MEMLQAVLMRAFKSKQAKQTQKQAALVKVSTVGMLQCALLRRTERCLLLLVWLCLCGLLLAWYRYFVQLCHTLA
jgi:CHASE2 domain-containing sensor protein